MPRRATRARRIPFSVGPFSVGGCRMVPTPGQRYRGRRDGLDIEAGGGVVVAPFSVGPFSVGPCRMVPTPGQLRGQPDNTPHRNGTDDRALGRVLALAFPAGAIGLFIWWGGRRAARPIKQAERQTDPHLRRPTTSPIPFSPNGSGRRGAGARMVVRPPLRPDADVGFAGSGSPAPRSGCQLKHHRQWSRTETATEIGPR